MCKGLVGLWSSIARTLILKRIKTSLKTLKTFYCSASFLFRSQDCLIRPLQAFLLFLLIQQLILVCVNLALVELHRSYSPNFNFLEIDLIVELEQLGSLLCPKTPLWGIYFQV